ncbi:MAG: hypothetical protein HC945_01025 [Nitrosarchaeum sp.]|nr:hypothetical protein [Nitrosarchaeum sp.]
MNAKGSYFYVVDAFIAGMIIVLTLFYLTQGQVSTTGDEDLFAAEKALSFIHGTDVRDYDSPTMRDLRNMSAYPLGQGSLLNYLAQIHYASTQGTPSAEDLLQNLSRDIIDDVVRKDYGASLRMGTDVLHTRRPEAEATSLVHYASSRLAYYQVNDTHIHGPHTVLLEVWR